MPHCIIEYSDDLEGKPLVEAVHQSALDSGLFSSLGSDIKVRAMPYSHYKTGSIEISFVHVTLKILSGRTGEQKSSLTEKVLKQLKALNFIGCSLSVEVVDIDTASYAKSIV